ncbi:MAG: DegT/DnrJ/EryC1/StrS family aminotransferase [Acidimicrobiales bacterium]
MIESEPGRHAEPMKVDFAPPSITDVELKAVEAVLRSGWLTTGPVVAELESALADYLEAEYVVCLNSATAGIETALAYLELPRGTPVAIPVWTYISVVQAAIRCGLQPVLVDVDPATLNLCPSSFARAIESGVKAAVPLHFGGAPYPAEIDRIAANAGVSIVEDAAHAIGGLGHDDRPIAGRSSVAAAFSFYSSKNLTSGEGGALATSDSGLARFAMSHRLNGIEGGVRNTVGGSVDWDISTTGIKANLPDVLAAIALAQLGRIDTMQRQRRALVNHYRTRFAAASCGVEPVPAVQDSRSADHLIVVAVPESIDRAQLQRDLALQGVATSVHFRPVDSLTWSKAMCSVVDGGTPGAHSIADRTLSLPLSPEHSLADADYVCDVLFELLS